MSDKDDGLFKRLEEKSQLIGQLSFGTAALFPIVHIFSILFLKCML